MSAAPRPYTRGWVAPWRGQWGTLKDGHSRLGKLARRIEREILAELPADLSPLLRRRVKAVAALGALAEQARQMFGIDPKVTRRAITASSRGFESELSRLRAAVPGVPMSTEESFAARVRKGAHAAS